MVHFESNIFGYLSNDNNSKEPIWQFTWTNKNKISVKVVSYGATITSICMPDTNGKVEDIVMGFDTLEEYQNNSFNPYFGATIGRVANRIANSQICIDNVVYNLRKNWKQHQLHGGPKGFDKVKWNWYISGNKLILSHLSPHDDQGFPGDCLVNVEYELTDDNEFRIIFTATATQSTYVNLTNHSYFNLAGHDKGAEALYEHMATINANAITEVDVDSIPTGKLIDVANTVFDLRVATNLGKAIKSSPQAGGFDHNFCIDKGSNQSTTFIAKLYHPKSGRLLEVYSDQPGVQFYTSNFLPDKNGALIGKNGTQYNKHGAFCLETQNYPDAIHHEHFPKSILRPGESYVHNLIYKLIIK